MKTCLISLILLLSVSVSADDVSDKDEPKSISDMTSEMQKYEGFFTYYWDDKAGKIWLEIENLDEEFLYLNSLPHGVGSNDIGLDRGQMDDRRVVFFRRIGPKLLLIQPNYDYRALTNDADEREAVEQSFAISTLHGFEIAAETNERVLVDATSFFLNDARGVVETLKSSDQGSFKLDLDRSSILPDETKNFPDNTEISAMLTFTSDSPGPIVRQVTPTGGAVTIVQRHSLIRLPDDDYVLRRFDPRAGFFGMSFMDFSTPIEMPIKQRFIARHRLTKKNPALKSSEAEEPIIYYIERGAPEPIRSALMDGASWWNEAFEAAGYINAFQVELLPEDADPMDVRYNVIQWVHRASRGWSYGDAIVDPRTGEIIKGHITLGSLRARQDYLIAEGLLGPYDDQSEAPPELLEMVLARIRQLSSHEVGHTLGLRHNFAASINNRASVMDYPYPYVKINDDDQIDLSDAYSSGIGEWDKAAIIYGYGDFSASGDGQSALDDYLANISSNKELEYITDSDARPTGSAHPRAHLWDNGSDPIDELGRLMNVRRHLLDRFSERNLAVGRPMALLEEVLVPIYMFHRYQIEAASKLIGGIDYSYSIRGNNFGELRKIDGQEQRRALDMLLSTITPEALAIPDKMIQLIPPHTTGYRRSRENFARKTGSTFDPLTAAESAANLTVRLIFQRHRAARLIEHHAIDNTLPALEEVIDKTLTATWKTARGDDYFGEIRRVVDAVVLHHLIALTADDRASTQVRAVAFDKLDKLRIWLEKESRRTKNAAQHSHLLYAHSRIKLFQRDPSDFQPSQPADAPAGSPIGIENFDDGRIGCDWQ